MKFFGIKSVLFIFASLFLVGFLPSLVFAQDQYCLCEISSPGSANSVTCVPLGSSPCRSSMGSVVQGIPTRSCSVVSQCPETTQQSQNNQEPTVITTKPTIQVDILGVSSQLQTAECVPGEKCEIAWIGQYVGALFRYGVSIAIALSVLMIMIGGLLWLMSGGRQDQIGRAKEFITGSLSGLLLALFSVIILQAVNPGLVSMDPFSLRTPGPVSNPAHTSEPRYSSDKPIPPAGTPSNSSEAEIRLALNDFGIDVWQSRPGATRVEGLPDTSINYLIGLGTRFGGSPENTVFILTGATEDGYHSNRHGMGRNTFDLNIPNNNLQNYVQSNHNDVQDLGWGTAYYLDNVTIDGQTHTAMWVDEGNHWHVEIHQLGYRDR